VVSESGPAASGSVCAEGCSALGWVMMMVPFDGVIVQLRAPGGKSLSKDGIPQEILCRYKCGGARSDLPCISYNRLSRQHSGTSH
jgi:hypothetical protein